MRRIYVTANRSQQIHNFVMMINDAEKFIIDYSPWVDDNGTVTFVTASVKSGQAAISGESLTSNVKEMAVTVSEQGKALIKLTATDGTYTNVIFIKLLVKDPEIIFDDDYGLRSA